MIPALHYFTVFFIPQSLAQTDHMVSAVYLAIVCKKGSNAMLRPAAGRAEIPTMSIQYQASPRTHLARQVNQFTPVQTIGKVVHHTFYGYSHLPHRITLPHRYLMVIYRLNIYRHAIGSPYFVLPAI